MSLRGKRFAWIPAVVAASFGLAALQGCEEEGTLEEAGEDIDEAAEETAEDLEDAADDVEDEIDDGIDDDAGSTSSGG
jgi:hypothetical protein